MRILGRYTRTFTATSLFFQMSPTMKYWRFEVIYSSSSDAVSSVLEFIRNDPPSNGSCSIEPNNGTTSTLFNISCPNWLDEDEIEDYSLYSKIGYLWNSSVFLRFSSRKYGSFQTLDDCFFSFLGFSSAIAIRSLDSTDRHSR